MSLKNKNVVQDQEGTGNIRDLEGTLRPLDLRDPSISNSAQSGHMGSYYLVLDFSFNSDTIYNKRFPIFMMT